MRPAVVPALLVLAWIAHAGDGIDLHRWDDAQVVRGERFEVRTNTWPRIAESLSRDLEGAAAAFERRFGPLPPGADHPMPIHVFRTREEYLAQGAGVAGAVGHFDAAFDRCALVWDGSCGESGWPIAVHEACHHWFRRRFPGVSTPSWYTEGIACWFEGATDATSPAHIARLRVRAARAAFEAGEADLDALLDARAEIRTGRLQIEPWTPSRFYALAWSFVHWLSTDPDRSEGFLRFERHLCVQHSVRENLERRARELLVEFCGPIEELEAGWHAHLRMLPEPAEAGDPAPVAPGELDDPDAFVRYRALRRLGERARGDALRADLRARLADDDVAVRLAATRLVAGHLDAADLPALGASLRIDDRALQDAALAALAHPDALPLADAVLGLARERGPLQESALRALARMGAEDAWPLLRAALVRPDLSAATRALCARALARDPWAEPLLRRATSEESSREVRQAARAALLDRALRPSAWDGREEQVDQWMRSLILHAALRDHPRVRALALAPIDPGSDHYEALPEAASPEGVLIALLGDARTTAGQRASAARLLGEARAAEAAPALCALCRPEHPDSVRLEAARALVAITGRTNGFLPGQPAREREAAYRAWAAEARD